MLLNQNFGERSISFNNTVYSNSEFYFLIPEHTEDKIKPLLKSRSWYYNRYQSYYQYLFIVHVALSDYLDDYYNLPKGNNLALPIYEGIDFKVNLWKGILRLDHPRLLEMMLNDLSHIGLLTRRKNKEKPDSDYRMIKLREKSNLKLLQCPNQFRPLVNQMSLAFNQVYYNKRLN